MTQKPLLRVEVDAHIGCAQAGKTLNSVQEGGVQNQHTAKKAQRRQGPSASSRAIHTSFRRPFSCLQALDQNAKVPLPYKACPGRVSLLAPYQRVISSPLVDEADASRERRLHTFMPSSELLHLKNVS
jgi:hypothetical protein